MRATVLEVVAIESDVVYVAAAWGKSSDWYQNVVESPDVTFQLGSKRHKAKATGVKVHRAEEILARYNESHPRAFARLAQIMLEEPGETPADWVSNVAAAVPVVELAPT